MLNDIIRYKTLIQSLNDAILVEDENRTISLTNQSFCDLFEILAPVDALIGADCSQSAEQSKAFFKDPEEFVKNVGKILKAQAPVYGEYIEMVNGKRLERDYIPIINDKQYLGHLWVYKDLTHHYELEESLRETQQKLSHQSLTDELTQIGNRRFLDKTLSELETEKRSKQTDLSIAMIDLDNFKRINDEFGHDTGDSVLKAFSDFLKQQIRHTDILARFGGEEFLLIMPETDKTQALAFLQRVLTTLNKTLITDFKLTFSAGISCINTAGDKVELIKQADNAMYKAKNQGRNNIQIHETMS